MKKAIVLSALGIAAASFTAFGQGVVAFGNYAAGSGYQPIYYSPTAQLPPGYNAGYEAGSSTEIQFLYALGDLSGDTAAQFLAVATAGATTFISSSLNTAGTSTGGAPSVVGVAGAGYFTPVNPQISGWTSGPVTFMMEAWETAGAYGGSTYATSQLRGQSVLFVSTTVVSTTGSPPPNPVQQVSPYVQLAQVVPEPTTLAFAGLGMLSLFAFARRKKAKA